MKQFKLVVKRLSETKSRLPACPVGRSEVKASFAGKTLYTFLVFIFLLTTAQAQEIETTLGGNTSSEGFSVKDNGGNTLFRVRGDGNIGIGTTTPGAKLDVSGNTIIGESTSNSHVIKGDVTFFPSSFNSSVNLKIRGLHPDGQFNIVANGNTQVIRIRGSKVGFGAGETTELGTESAIVIVDRFQGPTAHIPKLFIAARGSGPNNVSQFQIQRSDKSEWTTGPNYPNGANHFVMTTFLGTPLPASNHRAPLRIGAYDLSFYTGKSDIERMRITTDGNVGIGMTNPAALLHVNGSAGNNTGVWSNLSDRRLKKDVSPIQNALKTVVQLKGVTFRWKDLEKDAEYGRVRGLVAQDVERVLPEWVKTDPDGYKRLEPIGIYALLIEAIKEQQKQIEELEIKISSLTLK